MSNADTKLILEKLDQNTRLKSTLQTQIQVAFTTVIDRIDGASNAEQTA